MTRFSAKRQAILDCLRGTTVHPTAEWVYHQLKAQYPNLSLGTVYRNLVQLKEAGTILSMGVVAGEEHFDGNTHLHGHAMCIRCGRIDDVPVTEEMKQAMQEVAKATAFEIHLPQFAGLCPDCKNKQEKEEIDNGSEDHV